MRRTNVRTGILLLALCALLWPAGHLFAQGVTTAEITGVVKDAQGAVVPGVSITAVHDPSGTVYEAVTQGDGRFFIPGMRVGGPYKVTAALGGFRTEEMSNISLSLGVAQDLSFSLQLASIQETVTVVGASSPVFSSSRTGAATAVVREDLSMLPTVTGRVNDITRLSPQAGSNGTFSGQDNRVNNFTVDGAYFNNPFGLAGQPGDRTNVAPISLEAIEQIQVSVAPYDVRQGNFVGAGVNMVTRSGTNRFVGSFYSRYRNESFAGDETSGLAVNRGTFTYRVNGGFGGGPIIKNRLFTFGSFEKQEDVRPLTTFRANNGGEAVGGTVTRVLGSDLDALSAFLKSRFAYDTGPYNDINGKTPAKPFLVKFDYNLNTSNKVSYRFSRLDSSADKLLSGSSSAGFGRGSGNSSSFLGFQNSNYAQLENIRSSIAEWNSILGSRMSNSVIVGYTTNNENRKAASIFPMVDIQDGAGVTYTSFGTDPFTPSNQLAYETFQLQDSFTRFSNRHTWTVGGAVEKYHSNNVFFQLSNSVYVFSSLADFYADANGYLANPNRTTSSVTPRRFQLGYVNIPGLDEPAQELDAWYVSAYGQDQWQARSNLTVTFGLRVDTPIFDDRTTFANPVANALTFRDEKGSPVQYDTGKLSGASPLWSPRMGFNWDLRGDQSTQIRGGSGVFTGKPAYVWLSNQIGNTGILLGAIDDNPVAPGVFRGFNPNPAAYRPAVNGSSASSYVLNMTDPDFRFPQTWRTNIAVDRMLPWGLIATGEYLYNRDVNGVYYINANLPAAQSSFTGVDNRPRWVGTPCSTAGNRGGCVQRINAEPGNVVVANYVLKNQNVGRSWLASASLMKTMTRGLTVKGAYTYGESRNTIDAGSIAAGSYGSVAQSADPNNPGLGFSVNSPGHRLFVNASYTRQYFGLGATTLSLFWEAKTNLNNFATNGSYVFSGDMNGDGLNNNDLIYVPRDRSEMNFVQFTAGGRTFTVEDQRNAFEAYIQQDPYLKSRRGQYAERNGIFMPIVKRMDLSISQEIFRSLKGARHTGQIRLDVSNFGNLLNSKWGTGQRFTIPSTSSSLNLIPLLTNPTADATGRVSYRMAVINNALPTSTFQPSTFLRQLGTAGDDVYVMMLSFRYNFN